jgi:hypothetical protein
MSHAVSNAFWALLLLLSLQFATAQSLPTAPTPQAKTPIMALAVIAGEVTADGITTHIIIAQGGCELNPLVRPLMERGTAGQVAWGAISYTATIGVWYALRKSHHERAAKWFLRSVEVGEGVNVARNVWVAQQ